MLSRKIKLIKEELLPEVLADTLEITNVVELSKEYCNNCGTEAVNSQISIVATYKEQEVLISFFDGIGYRSNANTTKVVVLSYTHGDSVEILDDGCYYKCSDSYGVCQELHDLINSFLFEDIDEKVSLYENDCEFVFNAVMKLQAIEFIVVDEKIHRDITKRQSQVDAIQRLAKASEAASSGVLYQVFSLIDNALERLYQNLTKDEAEALYIAEANEWYKYDDIFTNIDEIQAYRDSDEYLDSADMANIVMEVMR